MATDLESSGSLLTFDFQDDAEPDRVLQTAEDRPHPEAQPALVDPAADHGDGDVALRRADVEEKHRRVAAFLDATGYDALVLTRADSLAWFTSGGDLGREMTSDAGAVWLFLSRDHRAVLADNVQSPRVFEEELAGLGFQLKERPWYHEPERLVDQLAEGKRVAADVHLRGLIPEPGRLRGLRLALTKLDRQRFRQLGRTLTMALEATCRNFQPGETETDLAGHLAHRLLREGVVPLDLRIAGDDRPARYRQPGFKPAPIRRRVLLSATGRRYGLCASATRLVSFGPVEDSVREAHGLAAMIDATCIYFSRPGETIASISRRARRIYEKFGQPHEWRLAYQGFLTGYTAREAPLLPESPLTLSNHFALRWCPSVGPVRSEDTVVIDTRGFEIITEAQDWPLQEVLVKGYPIQRPGILER